MMMMKYAVIIFVCLAIQTNAFNSMLQYQGPCNFMDTINITDGYKDENNSFVHQGVVYEYGTYGLYGYIIENQTEKIIVPPHYRGCVCKYKPCIRLCCVKGVGAYGDHEGCIKSNILQIYTSAGYEEATIDIESHEYGVLLERPCAKMFELEPYDYVDDLWYFLNNGSIVSNSGVADTDDYCFSHSYNKSNPDEIVTKVLLCFHEPNDIRFSVYPVGMLFSIPFLIITFLVYAFIPELRNLHGKCLMCYVLSLTILYISLSAVQLDRENVMLETAQCSIFGFSIYLCVLLCFFWLNVMCFDIWSTFRGGIRGRSGEKKRFLIYSIYAFGSSLTIATVVYLIDIYKLLPEKWLPEIGSKRCWMKDDRLVEAVYVYLPISIIMVTNIVLYSITAYKIWRVQKETSVIRHGDSQKHSKLEADTDRFFLYLRLFIIMGATWCMESISWVFDNNIIFYVSDFLNCVQGFIIFVLFVWKPKVKKLIIRRYRSIRKLPPVASQNMSNGNSSRTETSRISSGVHSSAVRSMPLAEKPMLDE